MTNVIPLLLDENEVSHGLEYIDNPGALYLQVDDDGASDFMDQTYGPEYAEDTDFKLEGYADLHENDDGDDDQVDDDKDYVDEDDGNDLNYANPVTGRKRKRVKHTRRNAFRNNNDEAGPLILEEAEAIPIQQSLHRVPGTWGRADRKKGETLPAYHKRVTHELDSDDELMISMRDKGFSDRQIAAKLAQDGRVRYDPKSIATRIGRIRMAQAQNVDFLLSEGYKEWEYEDDRLLLQAFALADIEVNYEIERIRAWRFRKVSESMRRLDNNALFSEKACRERYYALMNGTARIPTELDDDADTRRAEQETFRESRERIRNREEREKEANEVRERKLKEETKIRNAQKAEETANRRAQQENEKAQRAMQRAAAAQVRAQRAIENSTAKTRRNAQIKKESVAGTKPGKDDTPKRILAADDFAPLNLEVDDEDEVVDTCDPRARVSLADLIKMSSDRGLQTPGKSRNQLIQQLQDADDEWSLADLKKMCRTKCLKTTGNKAVLQYSLALAAAQACPSYKSGAVQAINRDNMLEDGEE